MYMLQIIIQRLEIIQFNLMSELKLKIVLTLMSYFRENFMLSIYIQIEAIYLVEITPTHLILDVYNLVECLYT
jgi:hypothetical protein